MVRTVNLVALFVLIGVVALRPLVTETYDSAETSISRALGEIGDPSPLRTLGFNIVILVCAVVVFLTRRASALGRSAGSVVWAWGLGLLIVAGVVSCWYAGQKRLAINATIDWLCYPILTLTLVQLLREPWARRLLLSAIIGSTCVVVWQCYEQYFVTFEETIQKYEAEKEAFWAQQGVELDSSKVVMFEARMRARQATGFMPHSNVAASFLALAGFALTGLVIARWRTLRGLFTLPRALSLIGAAIVALGVFGVVPLTGSRGAMLSAVVAGLLWLFCSIFHRQVDRHRRRLFMAVWGAVFGGALAVIMYGASHGTLPGVSLMFRWQYWTASADLIAEHRWTGVGRENFGRHYLAYKSIESPEEVANPHNFLVQAAADWGWPGFSAIILLLIGASWLVVFRRRAFDACDDFGRSRRLRPAAQEPTEGEKPFQQHTGSHRTTIWHWFIGLMVFVLGVRVQLLGTDDFYYVYYMTAVAFIAWSFGFLIAWCGDAEYGKNAPESCDSQPVANGITFGLLAFLIHDIINFALFVPATATVFFALLAIPLSEHGDSGLTDTRPNPHHSKPGPRWPGIVFIVATLIVMIVAVWPVAAVRHHLWEARSHWAVWQAGKPIEEQPAYRAFTAAADADRLDPTPLIERAQWLAGVAEVAPSAQLRKDALTLAATSVALATPRDPFNVNVYRLKMNIYLRLADLTQREADYFTAIEAAREALARYPHDPHGLVSLADAQAMAGRALERDELIRDAVENYRRALELDGQRLEWETLRRFQPSEIATVERKLDEVARLLASP